MEAVITKTRRVRSLVHKKADMNLSITKLSKIKIGAKIPKPMMKNGAFILADGLYLIEKDGKQFICKFR